MDDGSKRVQSSTASFFFFKMVLLLWILLYKSWAGHRCVRDHYTRNLKAEPGTILYAQDEGGSRCVAAPMSKPNWHLIVFSFTVYHKHVYQTTTISTTTGAQGYQRMSRVIKDLNRVVVDLIYKTDNNFYYIFIPSVTRLFDPSTMFVHVIQIRNKIKDWHFQNLPRWLGWRKSSSFDGWWWNPVEMLIIAAKISDATKSWMAFNFSMIFFWFLLS